MQIPDGLFFYEFVLLLLGVVLFIVLLIILIIYVIQKRQLKSLLPFFILPIVMIGYPGYQKMTFDNGVFTVEKAQKQLAENPDNSKARQELKEALNDVENKSISNPQTLLKISKGYAVIGDTTQALTFVDKALGNDPKSSQAKKLKEIFNKPNFRIEKITNEINNNPTDSKLHKDLEKEVSNLKSSSNLTVNTYEKLANTYAVMKDTNKVLRFTDSLIKINPNSVRALQLKKDFTKRP